jgi:hypothetical protein
MKRRFRDLYGSGPLHLIALLVSLAVIGAAIVRWFDSGSDVINILVWFGAALLGHDLVLLPVYTLLDRIATGPARRRRSVTNQPAWGAAYFRVPIILSALLFAVFFPLILGTGTNTYHSATGHLPSGYLARWLIASAIAFFGSGLAYAVRLRRSSRGRLARDLSSSE